MNQPQPVKLLQLKSAKDEDNFINQKGESIKGCIEFQVYT